MLSNTRNRQPAQQIIPGIQFGMVLNAKSCSTAANRIIVPVMYKLKMMTVAILIVGAAESDLRLPRMRAARSDISFRVIRPVGVN